MERPAFASRTRGFVALLALGALAAVVLAAARTSPATSSLALAAGAVGMALASFLAERFAVEFRWRHERVTTSVLEAPVLLALVFAPGAALLLGIAAGRFALSLAAGRPLLKSTFNASQGVLAGLGAASVFALAAAAGAPAWVAATLGAGAYTVTSEWILALLFATLEPVSPLRVFRERLVGPMLLGLAFGVGGGLVVLGLYAVHPLATLAAVPFFGLLVWSARAQTRAERELVARRRLADEVQALTGCDDDHAIAARMLAAARDILGAQGALVELHGGARVAEPAGATPGPHAIAADIPGREGEAMGTLSVWPRPTKPRYGPEESAQLELIAAQAGASFESARALREVAAQRDVVARHERMSTLGTLVAGVAHEVNNPLTYLAGNIDLALFDLAEVREFATAHGVDFGVDLAQTEHRLDVARQGSERIGHIVRSLRVAARGRAEPQNERVSLNAVVDGTATLLGVNLPAGVRLESQADARDPIVAGSSPDLHQVVLNLAKNAIEAVEAKGGCVRIASRWEGADAILEVEDDGAGIPPQVLERLFTPFFTTKGAAGTGLGLSIANGIVKEHGGKIEVESRVGQGTRFRVRMPRA